MADKNDNTPTADDDSQESSSQTAETPFASASRGKREPDEPRPAPGGQTTSRGTEPAARATPSRQEQPAAAQEEEEEEGGLCLVEGEGGRV